MLITDERTLADIACIEPIPVDGVLGLINLGETFLTCYFRWRAVKFENGATVYERTPAHVILRPRSAALAPFGEWLNAQRAPEQVAHQMIGLTH